MSKFTIENILIEKSDKDIQTGVVREFSEGINLICGNNEAGKSSLLAFIRQGFFKTKGVDKGKICFKINSEAGEKHYRTDIQDNRSVDMRCKVFDENNNPVSYDFIKDTINQKYFEQGFTINLDDLMNIQNKDTQVLVDTIKDPSGEKLSMLLDKVRTDAKKILGDNNRLTKDTLGILDKISKENLQINELSNLEAGYNSSIQMIKEISDELEIIYRQEEFLAILDKIKGLQEKLTEVNEQQNIILAGFNEKLLNNQEQYTNIIQNAGKVEANKTTLQKNISRIEQLNAKISSELCRLRDEFSINLELESIKTFSVDYNVLRQLKELSAKKNELEKELIAAKQAKENVEENLLRLKHEITPLNMEVPKEGELEKLKELYRFVDEHLTKFNYMQNKINDTDKSKKVNASGILTSKGLFALFILLFVMTIAIAFSCFYNRVPEAGIFAVLMAVFLFFGLVAMKISSYTDSQETERKRMENVRDNILSDLMSALKEYYSEIENVESSYLPIKIENLKTEIQNKIQNYTRVNDILAKNAADTAYNTEKLNNAENKLAKIQSEAEQNLQEAKALINSVNNSVEIPADIYVEVVEVIKNLKEDFEEKTVLEADIEQLKNENAAILDNFNKFISETELKLSFGENFTENVQRLKTFNETNTGLKNNIDILNAQLDGINAQIAALEEKKNDFSELQNNHISKEELNALKQEKLNQKKDAEFKKRELEKFEGLNDIKIKKAILLEEYRKKIFSLMKNKMILQVVQGAKDGFDKVQPDLKKAQEYLEILTDGKYSKINLDLEEIQSADGSLNKKWMDLSRGTKEQVYLALRLGYASNYTKDRVTAIPNGKADLPLIIDDAFVNFDAPRTRQGIKCLIEFAKTNQVLFFTCHNEVMQKHFEELCNEQGISLNVIHIG